MGRRALVVDVIRSASTISRADVAEMTGLAQPSISNIVRFLIADGIRYDDRSARAVTAVSCSGSPVW
jgi:hypothetical protein